MLMDKELAESVLTTLTKLRIELQAVRWAMWYAIDAWENRKPWGVGFVHGQATHSTDVGTSLVEEGRRIENDRETRGMNNAVPRIEDTLRRAIAALANDEG